MKTTHAGMSVTDQHFDALVEDLVKSLDKYKVPTKEQQELLGLLGPMRNPTSSLVDRVPSLNHARVQLLALPAGQAALPRVAAPARIPNTQFRKHAKHRGLGRPILISSVRSAD